MSKSLIKGCAIILCFGFMNQALSAPEDYFITTWDAQLETNGTYEITIPINSDPSLSYDYDVDWDYDGTFNAGDSNLNGDATHAYLSAGLKTIAIRGDFPAIQVSQLPQEQRDQLLTIDQWGTGVWQSMIEAFEGATNLTIAADDNPDFSQVENMQSMFGHCDSVVIGNKSANWNTSSVTNMTAMFINTSNANPNTSNWDTGNVWNFGGMFDNALSANPDVSLWDTSSATDMSGMFQGAISARPVTTHKDGSGVWDVSNVVFVNNMFKEALLADPDVAAWDTSKIEFTVEMFYDTPLANPDVSGWNTQNLENSSEMFLAARSAVADVSNWNTSSLINASGMFHDAPLAIGDISDWSLSSMSAFNGLTRIKLGSSWPRPIYESILINFAAQAQFLDAPLILGAGFSTYCSPTAVAAKAELVSTYGWTITDNGQNCSLLAPSTPPDLQTSSDSGFSDSDNLTNATTLAFDVYCSYAGNEVTLYQDDDAVASDVCTMDSSTISLEAANLDEGYHNFRYSEANESGESPNSAPALIKVDLTAPDVNDVVVDYPIDGALVNSHLTSFGGTIDNEGMDEHVIIMSDENSCESSDADSEGQWSCTFSRPFNNGSYDFTIALMDPAGNLSEAYDHSVQVNTSIESGFDITAN
ncbi:MAG: BspA family leucine-rich repeat surface protein, partial [Marinicella sp.]